MKPLFFLSILMLTLGFVFPVAAETADSVWIESEQQFLQVGETITITVRTSVSVPLQGYTFQLGYDPACLQLQETTNLISGMNSLPTPEETGFVEATYFSAVPQVIDTALATVSFVVLSACDTVITLQDVNLTIPAPDGMPVKLVLDIPVSGISFSFGGIQVLATNTPPPLTSPTNIPQSTSTPGQTASTPTSPTTPPPPPSLSSWFFVLMTSAVGIMAIIAGIMFKSLRRVSSRSTPASTASMGVPMLVFERTGETIILEKLPARIGRGKSNDVNLAFRHLSRQHAQIYINHQAFYLADLGSKNGTFVNGKRIRNQSIALHNGDKLKFGRDVQTVFRIQVDMELTI